MTREPGIAEDMVTGLPGEPDGPGGPYDPATIIDLTSEEKRPAVLSIWLPLLLFPVLTGVAVLLWLTGFILLPWVLYAAAAGGLLAFFGVIVAVMRLQAIGKSRHPESH